MLSEIIRSARVSVNGRKYFTSKQKAAIVDAWEVSGMTAAEFCRRHELVANVLLRWRKSAIRGASMSIKHDGDLYTRAQIEALRKENDEQWRVVHERIMSAADLDDDNSITLQ